MSRSWRLSAATDRGAVSTRVTSDRGADAVVEVIRRELRRLCAMGTCGSFSIGVHVEGPDCDHEVDGG